jgi:hypothetical protein
MNCFYCCTNRHQIVSQARNYNDNLYCDICKLKFKGSEILYSCINCNFDVCKTCSNKPYSIGFRGLLAKNNLLEHFEKNPSTIKNLYRDLLSAEIYWKAQEWEKIN